MGHPTRLTGGDKGDNAPTTPSPAQTSNAAPPPVLEAPRGRERGAKLIAAHRQTDTVTLECRRDVQRFHPTGPTVGAPAIRSASSPRPSSMGPQPRRVGNSSTRGRRRGPGRASLHRRDFPRRTSPQELRGGIDGDRPRSGARGGAGKRDAPPPAAGPMQMDEYSGEGPPGHMSQPVSPRPRPRTPASTHPSGMWFCPMPRCARRGGASPTGWGCLQSLVSHLCSVHLSTGAAPPDAWLDAQGLRVCLTSREISPEVAWCPEPRYSTAILAALALGKLVHQHRRTRNWPGPSRRAWTSYTY